MEVEGVQVRDGVPPAPAEVEARERLEPAVEVDPIARLDEPEPGRDVAATREQDRPLAGGRAPSTRATRTSDARAVVGPVGILDERALDPDGASRLRRPRSAGSARRRRAPRCVSTPASIATATAATTSRARRVAARNEHARPAAPTSAHRRRRRGAGALAERGCPTTVAATSDERTARGSRASAQTVTSGSRSAKRLSPMPRTERSSFTERKPPRRSRSAMIAWARVGPMPGQRLELGLGRGVEVDGAARQCPATAGLRRRPSAVPAAGGCGRDRRPAGRGRVARRRAWPRG